MPVRASIQGKRSLAACRGGIRRQVTYGTGVGSSGRWHPRAAIRNQH